MKENSSGLDCRRCKETTRRVCVFQDGYTLEDKPFYRAMYRCERRGCALREIQEELEEDRNRRKSAVQMENSKNRVSADAMRNMRLVAQLDLTKAGELLGVSKVCLSQFENERMAIPLEVFRRVMAGYKVVMEGKMGKECVE